MELLEQQRLNQPVQTTYIFAPVLLQAPAPTALIDYQGLQLLLQVDLNIVASDLQQAYNIGQAMPRSRQARAAALIKDPQFQRWLRSSSATTFNVNGSEATGFQEAISPMTYASVLLSKTLGKFQDTASLTILT